MLLTLALSSAACLRSTSFHCSTNADCGGAGVCAPDNLCSVADGECSSGLRYSDTAGSQANECVGGGSQSDAGVDAAPGDGPIDAPIAGGCPAGYNTISNGQGNHKYRLVPSSDWMAQRTFCAATSATSYLAIPDDATELGAIAVLAAQTRFWVGIDDIANEGVYVNVKGIAQAFLPWEAGAPDNGPPPQNCVEGVMGTPEKINDERCNMQQIAVCECEP
jgi:hypothetical protein